jgi:ATP-dependent helicase/nuclease subunit A
MIPHEIINASAGTGKTWQLTSRYLSLLAAGAPPESIAALTFSRAAASEFFARIITRLADAATSPDKAAQLASELQQPHLDQPRCLDLLRSFINAMPSLLLGTLDSFFVRIARSFPFELGLSGDFAIMDQHQQKTERLRVYDHVFATSTDPSRTEAQDEFLRAFELATIGRDDLGILSRLNGFIDDWHHRFLENKDASAWGHPSRIWKGSPPEIPRGPWHDVLNRATAHAAALGTNKSQTKASEALFKALSAWTSGTTPNITGTLWKRLLDAAHDLRKGHATVKNYTNWELSGEAAHAFSQLIDFIALDAIFTCLEQTRGIHTVLASYDQTYHQLVRRRGQLSFQDVLGLLSGDIATNPQEHEGLSFASRQAIDYRLDARYHHWLLDEFQDTSRAQWKVIGSLCEEALQDPEGDRSFFAVGDPKQSIHVWRGAAPELLSEILDTYNGPPAPDGSRPRSHIAERPLHTSRRSGPAVISMVNQLMGNHEAFSRFERLADAAARWHFPTHSSHQPHLPGSAVVLEVPKDTEADPSADSPDDSTPDDSTDAPSDDHPAWIACAQLLREIQPLQRGLSVAILCCANRRALDLTDALRRLTGMEILTEADHFVASDNALCSALLDLLRSAAHPADAFPWQHVLMTPLHAVISNRFSSAESPSPDPANLRAAVSTAILAGITHEGFARTLASWADQLAQIHPLDPFSSARLPELLRCAAAFDDTGSRSIDEFTEFAQSWSVRESSPHASITVMTAHKSKGLTFDIVILPDLHDTSLSRDRSSQGLHYENSQLDWIALLPRKGLAATDPTLAAALRDMEGRRWLELFALLYVMVTRARFANYLIIPEQGKPSDSAAPSFARIVRAALSSPQCHPLTLGSFSASCLWREGTDDWFLSQPIIPAPAPAPSTAPGTTTPTQAPSARKPIPLTRKSPTAHHAASLFDRQRQQAMATGTALHHLFQLLPWSDQPDPAWHRALAMASPATTTTLQRCLENPEIHRLLAKPPHPTTLWREQPFDFIDGSAWVSGIFDRVVLHLDTSLQPTRATIIDFKSDAVASPEEAATILPERHASQLLTYRRAVELLTGLPPSSIEAWIISTTAPAAIPCHV